MREILFAYGSFNQAIIRSNGHGQQSKFPEILLVRFHTGHKNFEFQENLYTFACAKYDANKLFIFLLS